MSLVAYAASSDEESDYEDDNEATKAEVATVKPIAKPSTSTANGHGNISDEDEDYAPTEVVLHELKKPVTFTLSLPKPKNIESNKEGIADEVDYFVTPTFSKLPMPKNTEMRNTATIVEEDDEFLQKKAIPSKNDENEKPPPLPSFTKGRVKICIPSLKDFSDVDKDLANRQKNKATTSKAPKGSGLMSILPQAKSEQNFAKVAMTTNATEIKSTAPISKPAFIPDTVKNRRPAYNTEGVDGIKAKSSTSKKSMIPANRAKISLVACSGSEDSDEDEEGVGVGDFFSLNRTENLPEVSANEINAMVAKCAAKIAAATTKYLDSAAAEQETAESANQMEHTDNEELRNAQKRYYQQQELGSEAMQALVGSNAKRRRREGANEIQVMDISSDQVLPNREEWMRTALASSTSYQPTGVLVDEEPVAGTRRKHQITYLAHKAKANEAELQAMWAANRQNRRATQSKYGF